jgi:hypothetical protein
MFVLAAVVQSKPSGIFDFEDLGIARVWHTNYASPYISCIGFYITYYRSTSNGPIPGNVVLILRQDRSNPLELVGGRGGYSEGVSRDSEAWCDRSSRKRVLHFSTVALVTIRPAGTPPGWGGSFPRVPMVGAGSSHHRLISGKPSGCVKKGGQPSGPGKMTFFRFEGGRRTRGGIRTIAQLSIDCRWNGLVELLYPDHLLPVIV